ncbi:SRPBCC family protein [Lysobacter sp. BMK333-48F3]|uniref:type II toxin-antitoxin system RatA family toxin n=1 Tax=Lysobacter sp. BMK333-48F3 TaxID=2867962 RepID=UPI001C8B6786|nr:SRPBCC family protein [Lysobacter sp. BMK333-48F3]MBX9401269.1 SRPBCC family protein [Lysobacter sp. BMK333-48F3]
MALIERRAEILAPLDRVYAVSQDYAIRYEWDPFPERIEFVDDNPSELHIGSEALVNNKFGLRMRVRFVQLRPPTLAAVAMLDGPWFLEKFAGSWIFREIDVRRTEVRFRYSLRTRPRWLGWIVEPLAARYFDRVVRHRLQGLKRYCERLDPTARS